MLAILLFNSLSFIDGSSFYRSELGTQYARRTRVPLFFVSIERGEKYYATSVSDSSLLNSLKKRGILLGLAKINQSHFFLSTLLYIYIQMQLIILYQRILTYITQPTSKQ